MLQTLFFTQIGMGSQAPQLYCTTIYVYAQVYYDEAQYTGGNMQTSPGHFVERSAKEASNYVSLLLPCSGRFSTIMKRAVKVPGISAELWRVIGLKFLG